LWGREAIGPFAQVLQRRRYDWTWHTDALARSLTRLKEILPPKTPVFGMVTENEAGFDAAVVAAADLAGLVIDGVALRIRAGQTQMVWHLAEERPKAAAESVTQLAAQTIREIILESGEPSSYLHLQAGVMLALSKANLIQLPTSPREEISASSAAANTYNHIRQTMLEILTPTGKFLRFEGGKSSIEIGKWWPKEDQGAAVPLADRVEKEIVNLLQAQQRVDWGTVDRALCKKFPGLQTPDRRLIRCVLDSYADQDERGFWHLRENDTVSNRQADVAEIRKILGKIGEKLDFPVRNEESILWERALNGADLHFYVVASAVLSRILDGAGHPPEQGLIILPGGRAELVLHKRERNPRMSYQLDGGWRLVKFRHIRRMAESESVNQENLASYLVLDPIAMDDAQLPLF
jgi:hypothetical protein